MPRRVVPSFGEPHIVHSPFRGPASLNRKTMPECGSSEDAVKMFGRLRGKESTVELLPKKRGLMLE